MSFKMLFPLFKAVNFHITANNIIVNLKNCIKTRPFPSQGPFDLIVQIMTNHWLNFDNIWSIEWPDPLCEADVDETFRFNEGSPQKAPSLARRKEQRNGWDLFQVFQFTIIFCTVQWSFSTHFRIEFLPRLQRWKGSGPKKNFEYHLCSIFRCIFNPHWPAK